MWKGATANLNATPINIRTYENRYKFVISLLLVNFTISIIDKVPVMPYKYENPNNIMPEAIVLRTKYFTAASLDKTLDLFKAIREYKLRDDNSIPRKRTIRLLADMIIKQPIKAKTSKE